MLFFIAAASAQSLPDLATTTRRLTCHAPRGTTKAHPGAESFFSGAFVVDANGAVQGQERRYMYANTAWTSQPGLRGGKDCRDAWTIVGRRTPAGPKCPECAFGIAVKAVIDPSASTCERRVSSDQNRFEASYDVLVNGSSFVLRFPSGKVVGEGKKDGETFSWISEQTCMWF